jgi:hypothetical protein
MKHHTFAHQLKISTEFSEEAIRRELDTINVCVRNLLVVLALLVSEFIVYRV